jgi:hypothetical protein
LRKKPSGDDDSHSRYPTSLCVGINVGSAALERAACAPKGESLLLLPIHDTMVELPESRRAELNSCTISPRERRNCSPIPDAELMSLSFLAVSTPWRGGRKYK